MSSSNKKFVDIHKLTKVDELIQLAHKYYQNRDESHGIKHVMIVLENVKTILSKMEFDIHNGNILIIVAAALLHDAYDHKYVKDVESVKKNIAIDLADLEFTSESIQKVFLIIDNLSFSKEKKLRAIGKSILNNFKEYPELLTTMRNIVSDADKIDAVAEDAVKRMVLYGNHINPNQTTDEIIKNIRAHCDEKLFILVKDNYIRTPIGRKNAEKHIEHLTKLVGNDEALRIYVEKCLETN
jgi:HD superfamily phosphodiesterase